jgi:transposase
MNKQTGYSPEFRERAVQLVLEHQAGHDSQCAALESVAGNVGCTHETLRK